MNVEFYKVSNDNRIDIPRFKSILRNYFEGIFAVDVFVYKYGGINNLLVEVKSIKDRIVEIDCFDYNVYTPFSKKKKDYELTMSKRHKNYFEKIKKLIQDFTDEELGIMDLSKLLPPQEKGDDDKHRFILTFD